MADVALIRKRVQRVLEQARRDSVDRRARLQEAQKHYDDFLEARAIPAFRAVAMVLKSEGQPWEVMTPLGEVRMSPERHRDDVIALSFDPTLDPPQPVVHVTRGRGGRQIQRERAVRDGIVAAEALSEDDVVDMLLDEIRPWLG